MSGTLLRNCTGCGEVFEQPRRQGRPWEKCDNCGGRTVSNTVKPRAFPDDPPVRADGLCARHRCGKPRRPERSARYAGSQALTDPFCSTECAKRAYGVRFGLSNDSEETQAKKARGAELAAARFRERHPNTQPGMFAR